jgi:hypothetical protein
MNSFAHPLKRLAAMALLLSSPLAAAAAESTSSSLDSMPVFAKVSLVLAPVDPAYRLGPKARSPRIAQSASAGDVASNPAPAQPEPVKRAPAATVYNVGL